MSLAPVGYVGGVVINQAADLGPYCPPIPQSQGARGRGGGGTVVGGGEVRGEVGTA